MVGRLMAVRGMSSDVPLRGRKRGGSYRKQTGI
jgi:hypothetical protein